MEVGVNLSVSNNSCELRKFLLEEWRQKKNYSEILFQNTIKSGSVLFRRKNGW